MADQQRRPRSPRHSSDDAAARHDERQDEESPYRDEIPPRTDHIEEHEEEVGRADWNVSGRPGREQPDETSPDVRRGRSPEDEEEDRARDEG